MLGTDILIQFIIVGFLGLVIFMGAYTLPQKVASTALIFLIPYQPIDTKYASANTLLTFVVFIAMLMKGEQIRLPLLPQIAILLLAYLVSMSFANPDLFMLHALFVFNLVAAFLVLWIAYDLTLRFERPQGIIRLLVVMNVVIAVYCTIQLIRGPGNKLVLFGMEEFAMMHIRSDYRLTGPFGGPGGIAEYFVIMVYFLLHEFINSRDRWYRYFLAALAGVNLVLLITTGNRGGFLVLIGSAAIFLWLYRRILGPVRTIGIAIAGSILLALASAIAILYTDYGQLFDRLSETEIEGGVPDTRQGTWPMVWDEIQKRPIFGHGPRLRMPGAEEGVRYDGHPFVKWPHNLYLFLLFTVGAVGLLAFLVFLATPLFRCWYLLRKGVEDPYFDSIARTGVIVMIVFFVDQLKIEFLRFTNTDWWHWVFALVGILVGMVDRAKLEAVNGRTVHAMQYSNPRYGAAQGAG